IRVPLHVGTKLQFGHHPWGGGNVPCGALSAGDSNSFNSATTHGVVETTKLAIAPGHDLKLQFGHHPWGGGNPASNLLPSPGSFALQFGHHPWGGGNTARLPYVVVTATTLQFGHHPWGGGNPRMALGGC